MDVGRDLTLKSLQDTDDYSYESVSLNISGSYGSGFDASLGMTMDKMDSTWASVNEQTGISAGKGGYDITVGGHTQLDGAVIASDATADKNNLDTGTLGWNDIKNKAEFDVSHISMSIGSGGVAPLGFPGVPGVPIIVAYGEKDSSTTHSAIAEGNITIRDKENQQQDISAISNDTQNANNVLDKIFDAEKEQNKLEAIQLAGQIGQQITDISMNFGKIKAEKEAEDGAKKLAEALANDPDSVAQARENLAKKDISNPTSAQLSDAINSIAYNKIYESVMKDYGTGSDLQQAVQSANAALQGIIGGNLGAAAAAAAAGASAPYLAEAVKNLTTNKDTKEVDKLTNAIGHAIVGALVAQASGNNALAGAAGATSGELVSQLIVENLYPGKDVKDLTEAERKTVSDLSTIAAGAIGGITSGDLAGAATGADAGQNAVQNNTLFGNNETDIIDMFNCSMMGSATACERAYPTGQQYVNGLLVTGETIGLIYGSPVLSTNITIGPVANSAIQYGVNGEVNARDSLIAGWVAAATTGSGLWGTVGWNTTGGAASSYMNGGDPLLGGAISGVGSSIGYGFGKIIQIPLDKVVNPNWKNWVYTDPNFSPWTLSRPLPPSSIPNVVGNIGSAVTTEGFGSQMNKSISEEIKHEAK